MIIVRVASVILCLLISLKAGYCQRVSPLYGEPIYHLVEKGDFLFKIALKYNCSYPSIARANEIEDPNIIREGKELLIPSFMLLPKYEEGESIIINIPEFRLYHFRIDGGVKVYPICVGLYTWRTPIGDFEVVNKIENPTWYMPPEMAKRAYIKREILPPGPLNPLGDVWIGLDLKHIGIHSTNRPMSIGRALSYGCIRLYPEGAREFFNSVDLHEKGSIIYEPIKVTIWEENVYLEVHPDVYQLTADYGEEFFKKCEDLGIDTIYLDNEEIEKALREKRGIPVIVGALVIPDEIILSDESNNLQEIKDGEDLYQDIKEDGSSGYH